MSIEEEFEEFYKEYLRDKRTENVEIQYFDVSRWMFDYINEDREFDLANEEDYAKDDGFKGFFENIPLYQNGYIDGHYDIKTETLWEICPDCLNSKMYDEKNEVHYCPMCDNRRTRFKDKLFNALR